MRWPLFGIELTVRGAYVDRDLRTAGDFGRYRLEVDFDGLTAAAREQRRGSESKRSTRERSIDLTASLDSTDFKSKHRST